MANTPATDGTRKSRSTSSRPKLSRSAGICWVSGAARIPAAPDHGRGLDMLAVGQRDAGLGDLCDAGSEPAFDPELAHRILDDRTRILAHVGCDRGVAFDDDDARPGVLTEDLPQARRHLGCRLDAGEAAAGNHHCVAHH
ncbi:hypothetical protein ACVILL_004069 [Bradyrhizobium sp. USDA 3364]